MTVIIWIIVSILIFSVIVLLHEYGHYKTARIFWIKVDEFGLGIPPRAKKLWKNKSGTLFSLNWIPLWGFVKIAWESEIFLDYYGKKWKLLSLSGLKKKIKAKDDIFWKDGKKIPKVERKYIENRLASHSKWANFYEKNIFQKSIVLLAWVIMNFLLAGLIFSVLFLVWVQPIWINTFIPTQQDSKIIPTLEQAIESNLLIQRDGVLLSPIEGSPAALSWIQNEDILLKIDTLKFEQITEIQSYIKSKRWETVELYIERKTACSRNDEIKEQCPIIEYMEVITQVNNDWKIWTYLGPNIILNDEFEYSYSWGKALYYGFYEVYAQSRLTLSGLKILISKIFSPETPEDRSEALESVAGPIWIVSVITSSLESWIIFLILFAAIISVNLWVFNLLPIPALDGWRLLLLWIRSIIDSIFGKTRLSGDIENSIHVIFFLLLIALSVVIAYNDIIRIFSE